MRCLDFIVISLACSQALTQSFAPTGSMKLARWEHRATLLQNGLVLVTGGITPNGYTNAAELYDPASGTWRYTKSPMNFARGQHSATLLADGRVLLAGGGNSSSSLASCEVFDPASETFLVTASLQMARHQHQGVALADGRIMVVAGRSTVAPCCTAVASTEIYNPATGTWSPAAPVPTSGPGTASPGYTDHAVTLLPDGKVLMTGGYDGYFPTTSSAALLYDPASDTWRVLNPMNGARMWHTATVLLDGRVLIVGGRLSTGFTSLTSTEIYDPAVAPNGSSTLSAPLLGEGRSNHTATRLADGTVLVTGGGHWQPWPECWFLANSSAQLYRPGGGTWTEVGPMTTPRAYHTATRLPSGAVLLAGGLAQHAEYPSLTILSSAELYGAPLFTVAIDIKPGSYPNTINLGSGGTVPVAIFSTASFDARTVDPLSVTLASAPVKLKGNGTPMSSAEDVNRDGILDLVVHVTTQALQLSDTDIEATLVGRTFDGKTIQGKDTIRVLP